jgi:hypothetical protein
MNQSGVLLAVIGPLSQKGEMILDWSKCDALEGVPGKVSGAWVLRGTRILAPYLRIWKTVCRLLKLSRCLTD